MKKTAIALALVLSALAGCGGGVTVRPTASALRLPPKPKDCSLEFLQKAPGRPFDELAELQSHVTAPPAAGAEEVLRARACELGADAVIITRNIVTNEFGHVLVAGTAIHYTEASTEGAPPAPAAK